MPGPLDRDLLLELAFDDPCLIGSALEYTFSTSLYLFYNGACLCCLFAEGPLGMLGLGDHSLNLATRYSA